MCSIWMNFCFAVVCVCVNTTGFYLYLCVRVCLAIARVFVWKRTFMNVYVGPGCWSSLYTGLYKVQVFSVRPWFLSPHPKGFERLTFLLDLSLCTAALGKLCADWTCCSHQLADFSHCSFMVSFYSAWFSRDAPFSVGFDRCLSWEPSNAFCSLSLKSNRDM